MYDFAVDDNQIEQVQNQIDQTFESRYSIPYYGAYPELNKRYEPHDAVQLQKALNDIKSLTTWRYVAKKFDCSNMSALTEFYLSNAGFDAVMVVGQSEKLASGHAWVVVLLSGAAPEEIPVECTTAGGPTIPSKLKPTVFSVKGIKDTQSYDDYINGGWVVEDIYQATGWAQTAFNQTLGSDNEFNWWDTTQVNWSLLSGTTTVTKSSQPPSIVVKTSSTMPFTNLVTTSSVTPVQPPSIVVKTSTALAGAITIKGAGFTPNGSILPLGIVIGENMGNDHPIFLGSNGTFNYNLDLSVLNGTFTVVAADSSGKRATTTFTINN